MQSVSGMSPFEDGEEYISIAPKDFIILRKEYQNLVSNSFLLHSFYNYHHVILGKAGKEDSDMYYIGVPGNYLDREKWQLCLALKALPCLRGKQEQKCTEAGAYSS